MLKVFQRLNLVNMSANIIIFTVNILSDSPSFVVGLITFLLIISSASYYLASVLRE